MRKRICLVVVILLSAIGFAAISTTLMINGITRVSENTEDFSVIFTKASLDGTDVYANIISEDKKTINFSTNDLKTLNQTSVLNYEVTNNSSNYDAEVSVSCKVKDNTKAKYTSIKNELENNATVVKAKETLNGTLTITLNKTATEEVRENYVCTLTFNAIERDTTGINIPDPVSFSEDTWETIAANVKSGNTDVYNVGDTKGVDLGTLGTHTVRISNKSECTNGETSETACGFVVEFADIINEQRYNSTNTSIGSWPSSEMRTYIGSTIYNALPIDLQNVIVETKVISGHGDTETNNFTSTDKLYLFSSKEVWGEDEYDTVNNETRQLDYYKNLSVSKSNSSGAIKKMNETDYFWYLRSPYSGNSAGFIRVGSIGNWSSSVSSGESGISPAFRIA